jgi:hypothetical protein
MIVGVIAGNFFNQTHRLGDNISKVTGLVISADSSNVHWDTIAMISVLACKIPTTVFVPQGVISMAQCAQVIY